MSSSSTRSTPFTDRCRIRRSRSAAPSTRFTPQARTYSFGAQVVDLSGQNTVINGGMRKFVNELPGLGAGAANNLGQYIPVAVPDQDYLPRHGLLRN